MKKKLLSILLILALAFTLSVTVSAEEVSQDPPTEEITPEGDGSTEEGGDTAGEGEQTPTEQTGFKIVVSKTEFYRDAEAAVTLTVETNPGIKNFMFVLDYDKENLEYAGFSLDKSVFTGATVLKEDPLQVAGITTSNVEATGLMITVRFKAKEGAATAKEFKVDIDKTASYIYDISEQKIDFAVEAGHAKIACRTHVYGTPEHLDATCTDDGYTKNTCTECGYIDNAVIPATGHNVSQWMDFSMSTCAVAGKREGTCLTCGKLIQEDLPLAEHEFTDWVESITPTLEALGESRRSCLFCGYEEFKNIAKLVTGITDATSGATVLGNDGLTFYGDAAFSAKQSLFKDLDEAEQSKIKALISSLVGKQAHSKYSVNFVNADGTDILFQGTVTVTLPIDSSLEGVVVVGNSGGNITVLNATVEQGLATFTVGYMADEFYILRDEEEESIVNTFQNIFADENGEVGTAGKIAGWVIIILIALILLGLSVAMIIIGIRQQKAREKRAAVTETKTEFTVEEPTPATPDADVQNDEEYDEAVRQLVQDWFDGPSNQQ